MHTTIQNQTIFNLKSANGFSPKFSQKSTKTSLTEKTKFIKISFDDFYYEFEFNVIRQEKINKKQVYYAKIEGETLIFSIENQGKLGIEPLKYTSKSLFLLSTIHAIMALSARTKIKSNTFDLLVLPTFNINQISQFLQQKSSTHKLMVIEKVFNLQFNVPNNHEVSDINYCYHSIVDREFEWGITSDVEIGFSEINEETKDVFGKIINLGNQKFTVVKKGIAKVESITTPTLLKNTFSKNIQKLIDLDEKLDSVLMDKYFQLAYSTLDGLSEEQKEAILERPHLDKEAFSF